LTKIKLIPPHPVMLLHTRRERTLVVCDLHIGWERVLIQKGVHIPSQTPKIKKMLLELIKNYRPLNLIVLGDVKDAIAKVSVEEWKDVPEFFETMQNKVANIQVVMGNHDGTLEPLLPERVEIIPSTGIRVGDVGLFHGHAWPAPELLECKSIVTGHVHPTITIRDPMGLKITRQVFVKAKCNPEKLAKAYLKYSGIKTKNDALKVLKERFNVKLKTSTLFIMPSFNQFLGGQPINERDQSKIRNRKFIGPILRSGCVEIDEAEVYLLDGTFMGKIGQLKSLN